MRMNSVYLKDLLKMENNIQLNIHDFGPINEANININQINVIGGSNASGKSFTSKLLFCFLTALSNNGKRIENEGLYVAFGAFISRWADKLSLSSLNSIKYDNEELKSKLNSLMINWDEDNIQYDYLLNFYHEFERILNEYGLLNDSNCKKELDGLKNSIDVDKVDFGYVGRVINYLILVEFGQKELKYFENANIRFGDEFKQFFEFIINFKENSFNIKFNHYDGLKSIDSNNVIYIDSVSLLDFNLNDKKGIRVDGNTAPYHDYSLLTALIDKKDNISSTLKELYTQYGENFELELTKMIEGNFKYIENDSNFLFISENGNELETINVASGYKQIGLLQLLLSNHSLSEGDWLIIDEPEINLHPSLQIQLVELLVKLAKEFNLTIYINSHSPFIIEAFEVYSKRENMDNKTSFFLCDKQDEKSIDYSKFDIIHIGSDELQKIYNNLADPYEILNSIRFENQWSDDFD